MFEKELMETEDYQLVREKLTADEIFSMWWSGKWGMDEVFICNKEDSAPEAMFFLPEVLGRLQGKENGELRFSVYKPACQVLGKKERICRNCERYSPLYRKVGGSYLRYSSGYCLPSEDGEPMNVKPGDQPHYKGCFRPAVTGAKACFKTL